MFIVPMAVDGGRPPLTSNAVSNNLMSRDAFLQLLMAQIRHQDPMSPLENTEFVAQLTQFSILEQNLNLNALIEQQNKLLTANHALESKGQVLSVLGREVVIAGNQFNHEAGQARSLMFSSETGGSVAITVRDAGGAVVHEATVSAQRGFNRYVFDGRDRNGDRLPSGYYTVQAVARDPNSGQAVPLTTYISGTVRGVDFSTETAMVDVDGVTLPAAGILAIKERGV